jgi:SAM-dependent methyltransferase
VEKKQTTDSGQWFSQWFNADYLKLYSHRDEREARSVADLITSRVPLVPDGTTLDLACGAGRHVSFLSARQETVGLDLSPWLLDVARQQNPATPLVRADMRSLPFRDGAFTLVVNLFTSFGYFTDDAQNKGVLAEVARVTADGGWLVLDFLNAPAARGTVVPFDRTQIGSSWVEQRRDVSASGRFIRKTINLETEGQVFTERVRLFDPSELIAMLVDCGFTVAEVCGDYHGHPLTSTSPRAILIARRHTHGFWRSAPGSWPREPRVV